MAFDPLNCLVTQTQTQFETIRKMVAMLQSSLKSGVRVIQLDHRKIHALDLELCTEITAQLRNADEDSECRALIFTATGRIFSAGVDLKRIISEPPEYLRKFLPALVECFETALKFTKPAVAAINGHAVAGGCILAAACDYRIGVPTAKIGIPELRVGVPLPMVALEIMRLVAAPSHFQQLVNLGATYVGQQAISVGLVDELAGASDLLSIAEEKTQQMIEIPLPVFQLTKRQIRHDAVQRVALDPMRQEVHQLWHSEEIRNTIREYVGQRL